MRKLNLFFVILIFIVAQNCNARQPLQKQSIENKQAVITGAEQLNLLLPLLENKKIGLVVNHTALVGSTHLADTLLSLKINIEKIFAPEHGFRGDADAGDKVRDSLDTKTKIKIISLYGEKKKPSDDDLKNIDVMVFDIQDVGVRFYTFISTLQYLMESCAENNKLLIVLDRPNPNGWYVDGPVLDKRFKSFVGAASIPVVHGLTVGEYALMANGEKWLTGDKQCLLKVISCKNYTHRLHYKLPVKPSPNLPNETAVYNYPSVCYFEGTDISVGRGTDYPFQMIGAPAIKEQQFSFTPQSKPGAKNPPHNNQVCFGYDLRRTNIYKSGINLSYLLKCYSAYSDPSKFFLANGFFDKLAGTDELRKQIIAGKTENEIKASWEADLKSYKTMRKKYLLYDDFE